MLEITSDLTFNINSAIAISCLGLVIKSLDDFIDNEYPLETGLLATIGKGFFAYSLLLLTIAFLLEMRLTASLFLASYGVGMFKTLDMKLPSGMQSWTESILALLISIVAVGINYSIWALLVMFAIQLFDDLIDFQEDKRQGINNFTIKLGKEQAIILCILIFYLALVLKPFLSVAVFIIALLISELFGRHLVKEGTSQ